MKLLLQSAVTYLLFAEAVAFAPASRYGYTASSFALEAAKESNNHLGNSIKAFGVAATIFAFNLATPSNVEAQDVFGGSSLQVAETIKTMEFSLPSSYDAISDVKKSSVDELSQEENLLTGTVVKKVPKAATERMTVSPKLTDEEKKAIEAQKKADKEAAAAAKAASDAEKKAEREIAAKEKAVAKAAADKEKAATKKAQSEAKARAEAAKEEAAKAKQFSDVEFVDTGLPSYGDSAKMRGKSAFSI
ncbi:unnamed protein product [Cylindrotheca closterium]|uniref:PS II complex 12 kDa extrinsic protein n=1 Tax=Cylindrotheca closterium TaxID=2856 RepID=A0AAD2CHA2_9STRA|nr:unnamed protein product [Cylindrotheca closterium]